MKKIILIFVCFVSISSKSQTQIFDLHNDLNYGKVVNGYYRDLENFLNQFEGIWVYQNGQEYLEVQFLKKEEILWNSGPHQFYKDVLIGEYRYVDVNGIEKTNSISNLQMNFVDPTEYNISSGFKIGLNDRPMCPFCPQGTQRFLMYFDQQENDDLFLNAYFIIWRVIENGVIKLKVQFVPDTPAGNWNKVNGPAPSTFRHFSLPYGNYTLIKQ